jgi:hypothetical protein
LRRHVLVAIAALLFLAGVLSAPARAATVGAAVPQLTAGSYGSLCDNATAVLCARNPSSGPTGTALFVSVYSGTNAMKWDPVEVKAECGGFTNLACPTAELAQRYPDDPIYEFKNLGSGDCLGANSSGGWIVEMKTCGDADTLFVYNQKGSCGGASSDDCYTVSVKYDQTEGAVGWLCGASQVNGPMYISNICPSGREQWG